MDRRKVCLQNSDTRHTCLTKPSCAEEWWGSWFWRVVHLLWCVIIKIHIKRSRSSFPFLHLISLLSPCYISMWNGFEVWACPPLFSSPPRLLTLLTLLTEGYMACPLLFSFVSPPLSLSLCSLSPPLVLFIPWLCDDLLTFGQLLLSSPLLSCTPPPFPPFPPLLLSTSPRWTSPLLHPSMYWHVLGCGLIHQSGLQRTISWK